MSTRTQARIDRAVYGAGMAALSHIARTNGDRLPSTLADVLALPVRYGVVLKEAPGQSQIVISHRATTLEYDPSETSFRIRRTIIHELAEYILRGDYPTLFDHIDPIRYDGLPDPRDFRHQAAKWAETVYAEWLRRFTE